MYIAVNMQLAHYNLQRALKFAIRKEDLIDIIWAINQRPDWEDYQVYYIS